ncbi:MAG: DUF4785 domain-containing protein [Lysobacteraceae bacterium]
MNACKHHLIRSALVATLLAAAPLALAGTAGTLAAPAAGDVVPSRLVAAPPPALAMEREPVQFAWALDPAQAILAPAPFVAESREYWQTIEADELQRGYAIQTTAPGALVRISPVAGSRGAGALRLEDFELSIDGRRLSGAQAFADAADYEALRATDASFPDGTMALRIDPVLGEGRFELRNRAAGGRLLVHVFEPGSPVSLTLADEGRPALAGGRLQMEGRLLDAGQAVTARRVGGLLTAPDGRSWDIDFDVASDGRILAGIDLPREASGVPGLWEVHAFAVHDRDGAQVLRDVRTAVAVAAPTARLAGGFRGDLSDGVRVGFEVETASEGRYEIRAVLHGTDASGRLVPAANAHAAAWLPAGGGTIELHVPAEVIAGGLRAPFQLRDVALSDQGRLGRLEQRAQGPVITAPPVMRGRAGAR